MDAALASTPQCLSLDIRSIETTSDMSFDEFNSLSV